MNIVGITRLVLY